MAKNTSILLEDNFETFINGQLQTGKFSSAGEVVHAALRLFEQEETKKLSLSMNSLREKNLGLSKILIVIPFCKILRKSTWSIEQAESYLNLDIGNQKLNHIISIIKSTLRKTN